MLSHYYLQFSGLFATEISGPTMICPKINDDLKITCTARESTFILWELLIDNYTIYDLTFFCTPHRQYYGEINIRNITLNISSQFIFDNTSLTLICSLEISQASFNELPIERNLSAICYNLDFGTITTHNFTISSKCIH